MDRHLTCSISILKKQLCTKYVPAPTLPNILLAAVSSLWTKSARDLFEPCLMLVKVERMSLLTGSFIQAHVSCGLNLSKSPAA